ncbi:hypothetical protein EVAR_62001_1 [Eumeta japonica]|uniref:Uncharacterized protein n=1 Tax=Eumeta variegata TaxID=151549 RepID=A0A4C1YHN9_EUMVA|nr:hypothetical protein EVAR_62001_1 [Eumeta japonica]
MFTPASAPRRRESSKAFTAFMYGNFIIVSDLAAVIKQLLPITEARDVRELRVITLHVISGVGRRKNALLSPTRFPGTCRGNKFSTSRGRPARAGRADLRQAPARVAPDPAKRRDTKFLIKIFRREVCDRRRSIQFRLLKLKSRVATGLPHNEKTKIENFRCGSRGSWRVTNTPGGGNEETLSRTERKGPGITGKFAYVSGYFSC